MDETPRAPVMQYRQCPFPSLGAILMQDDLVALFAYDRWDNTKVLDACRKLTAEHRLQFLSKAAGGHCWLTLVESREGGSR